MGSWRSPLRTRSIKQAPFESPVAKVGVPLIILGQLGLTVCLYSMNRLSRREVEFQVNKAAQIARISRQHDSRLDSDTGVSDSSAEEDVKEASAAPVPDAGITYSFDAARGPGRGSQILGMALAKAVEKFETKQTEKLVKEEYEVVGKESEDGNGGYVADEDDFMLV